MLFVHAALALGLLLGPSARPCGGPLAGPCTGLSAGPCVVRRAAVSMADEPPLVDEDAAAKAEDNMAATALAAGGLIGLVTLGTDIAVLDLASHLEVAAAAAVAAYSGAGSDGVLGEALRFAGNVTRAGVDMYEMLDAEYEIGVKARGLAEVAAENTVDGIENGIRVIAKKPRGAEQQRAYLAAKESRRKTAAARAELAAVEAALVKEKKDAARGAEAAAAAEARKAAKAAKAADAADARTRAIVEEAKAKADEASAALEETAAKGAEEVAAKEAVAAEVAAAEAANAEAAAQAIVLEEAATSAAARVEAEEAAEAAEAAKVKAQAEAAAATKAAPAPAPAPAPVPAPAPAPALAVPAPAAAAPAVPAPAAAAPAVPAPAAAAPAAELVAEGERPAELKTREAWKRARSGELSKLGFVRSRLTRWRKKII